MVTADGREIACSPRPREEAGSPSRLSLPDGWRKLHACPPADRNTPLPRLMHVRGLFDLRGRLTSLRGRENRTVREVALRRLKLLLRDGRTRTKHSAGTTLQTLRHELKPSRQAASVSPPIVRKTELAEADLGGRKGITVVE